MIQETTPIGTGAPEVWGEDEESEDNDDKDDDLRKSVGELRKIIEHQAVTIDTLTAQLYVERDFSAVEV